MQMPRPWIRRRGARQGRRTRRSTRIFTLDRRHFSVYRPDADADFRSCPGDGRCEARWTFDVWHRAEESNQARWVYPSGGSQPAGQLGRFLHDDSARPDPMVVGHQFEAIHPSQTYGSGPSSRMSMLACCSHVRVHRLADGQLRKSSSSEKSFNKLRHSDARDHAVHEQRGSRMQGLPRPNSRGAARDALLRRPIMMKRMSKLNTGRRAAAVAIALAASALAVAIMSTATPRAHEPP